jgi:CrcB protein
MGLLLLLFGGALGTCARYGLSRWISGQHWAQGFPYATLLINVTGSFLLAVTATLCLERLGPLSALGQDMFLLLGTGFCGGYTTFSTFEWETFRLAADGSWGLALLNVLVSVLAGFAGVLAGVGAVKWLLPG